MSLFDDAIFLGRGEYDGAIREGGYGPYVETHRPYIYVMDGRIIASTKRWHYGYRWPWMKEPKRLATPDYESRSISEAEAIRYLLQGGVPLENFMDKLPSRAVSRGRASPVATEGEYPWTAFVRQNRAPADSHRYISAHTARRNPEDE